MKSYVLALVACAAVLFAIPAESKAGGFGAFGGGCGLNQSFNLNSSFNGGFVPGFGFGNGIGFNRFGLNNGFAFRGPQITHRVRIGGRRGGIRHTFRVR